MADSASQRDGDFSHCQDRQGVAGEKQAQVSAKANTGNRTRK
jgi:hypothetical protein